MCTPVFEIEIFTAVNFDTYIIASKKSTSIIIWPFYESFKSDGDFAGKSINSNRFYRRFQCSNKKKKKPNQRDVLLFAL